MRILIITLLMVSVAFADPYEDNYDKDAGAGANPYQYYDEIRNNDGNYKDLQNNYSDAPLGSLDTSDVPKDSIENDPAQNMGGYSTGASLSGKVSNENSLLGILRSLTGGGELTTLGETYVCNYDNITYDDKFECLKSCQTVCGEYKFNAQFGCQYPEDVLKISVSDTEKLKPAPHFLMEYKGNKFLTPPATAVCVNGMKSGKEYYTWNIEGDVANVVTPYSSADVGECYDMTKKPFYTHFQDYYRYMGYSVQSYLSKLGYVPSHTVDAYMNLVFSAIVSGACADGVFTSGIPNAAEVEMVRQGNTPPNIRDLAEKNDMYKMITENTDYSAYTCSISNNLSLAGVRKTINKSLTITVPDYPEFGDGNYYGTTIHNQHIGTRNNIIIQYCNHQAYTFDITDRLLENAGDVIISTNVKVLNYLLNGVTFNGCTAESISKNESCGLMSAGHNNSSIKSLRIQVDAIIETSMDDANVVSFNGCSVPEDCKLESEYVCDMNGNNCVQTVKGGNRTGESIPKMCSEISTTNDKYLVCADGKTISATGKKITFKEAAGYFTTKKEYKCSTPKEEKDYSAFLEQSKLIGESATVAPNGDLTFTSIGLDGKQDDFTTNVTLKDTQCVQTCKVKVPTNYDNRTIALPDGKTGTPPPVLNTPYYKPCVYKAEDDEWECVLEGNEKLVAGGSCGCPNDFVDVIVNLKFVDEAASGMVCSDKGKK